MGFQGLNVVNMNVDQVVENLGAKYDAVVECTGRHECVKIGIYAAKPGSTVVLVGLGQRDKLYELPMTHAAVGTFMSYSPFYKIIIKKVTIWCHFRL